MRIPLGRHILCGVDISRRNVVSLVRFAKGQRVPCVGYHDVVIGGRRERVVRGLSLEKQGTCGERVL